MKRTPEQLKELRTAFDNFAEAIGMPKAVREQVFKDSVRRGTSAKYLNDRASFFKKRGQ